MESSSVSISSAESTYILAFFTLCLGPRTECTGFDGITWPVTSQSKSIPDGWEMLLGFRQF
jgi:hypothetical protein